MDAASARCSRSRITSTEDAVGAIVERQPHGARIPGPRDGVAGVRGKPGSSAGSRRARPRRTVGHPAPRPPPPDARAAPSRGRGPAGRPRPGKPPRRAERSGTWPLDSGEAGEAVETASAVRATLSARSPLPGGHPDDLVADQGDQLAPDPLVDDRHPLRFGLRQPRLGAEEPEVDRPARQPRPEPEQPRPVVGQHRTDVSGRRRRPAGRRPPSAPDSRRERAKRSARVPRWSSVSGRRSGRGRATAALRGGSAPPHGPAGRPGHRRRRPTGGT